MIGKSYVKSVTGWTIVFGHILIIVYIFLGKSDEWDLQRQMSAALTVAPVTAVYFAAVVRSFIAGATENGPGEKVNFNYAAVTFLVPTCLLIGVFYVCHSFPSENFSKPEQLQQILGGIEVCLGGVVGSVIDSLFPSAKAS